MPYFEAAACNIPKLLGSPCSPNGLGIGTISLSRWALSCKLPTLERGFGPWVFGSGSFFRPWASTTFVSCPAVGKLQLQGPFREKPSTLKGVIGCETLKPEKEWVGATLWA